MTEKSIEKTPSWAEIKDKLLDATVDIPVDRIKPNNQRHRISDEYLETIFTSRRDAYMDVAKLKIALRGVIPVRNTKSKSVIPSNYIRRLSKITGQRWRQKKALHPDKNSALVKFYVDGTYVDPKKDKLTKRWKQLQIHETEMKLEDRLKGLEEDLIHILMFNERPPEKGEQSEFGFSEDNYLSDDERNIDISNHRFEISKLQHTLGRETTALEEDFLEKMKKSGYEAMNMLDEYEEIKQ